MRIILVAVVLVVAGAVLAGNLLLDNRTLSAPQLEQARTACLECHVRVPPYDRAVALHDTHAALNCSRCHVDSDLQTAAGVHNVLKWAGIGILAVSLAGILANFIIANRRIKRE